MYRVIIHNEAERDLLEVYLITMGYIWSSGTKLSDKSIKGVYNYFPVVINLYSDGTISYCTTNHSEYDTIRFNAFYESVIVRDKLKEFLCDE